MVYMEPNSIGIQPLVDSWMKVLPEQIKGRQKFIGSLKMLFKDYLEECIEFVRINCKEMVTTSDGNLAQSLMKILDCFLEAYKQTEVKKISTEQLENLESIIDKVFRWALVWSVGCTTNLEGRNKFNVFLKDLDMKKKVKIFPEEGTVYDYEFKEKDKEFHLWTESFENY